MPMPPELLIPALCLKISPFWTTGPNADNGPFVKFRLLGDHATGSARSFGGTSGSVPEVLWTAGGQFGLHGWNGEAIEVAPW